MDGEGQNLIVIGGGQAGARAAFALRDHGYGGSITLIGDERHLPYERPILSKGFLLDAQTPAANVASQDAYREQGIELATGQEVLAINPQSKCIGLGDGRKLAYDRLLIATGSRVRKLAYHGVLAKSVRYLRTVDDARALEQQLGKGRKVVVVGGGFIGLEVAASAAKRGCDVTVLELADRLLPRLGCKEASDYVLDFHRAAGIDIRLQTQVEDIADNTIQLGDGSHIDANVIVAGIGVSPETALADAAGLEVEDGILTNEFGQTSDPDIYAVGDVTRQFHPIYQCHLRQESWQNANLQADCAASAICGKPAPISEIPWLWSDQGELNFQMAGHAPDCDRVVVRRQDGRGADGGLALFQFKGQYLVGGVTINQAKSMPLIRRRLDHHDIPLDPALLEDETMSLRKILSVKERK